MGRAPFPAPPTRSPPDTSYVSGPVMDTANTSLFTFTGSDNVTPPGELLFECRLLEFDPTEPPEPVDPTEPVPPEEMFVGCANPWQVELIEDGTYRFEVRAVDRAGEVDPTPAVHEFTLAVDGTAPDTQLVETPPNPSAVNTATFTFTGTDNRTDPRFLEFECRIDSLDPVAWLECTNPATYSNLTPGQHTVQVRAVDLEGNIDPTPASYTWTVGTPPDCDAANITLVATDDATVDEGSVVENFGGAEDLTVRSQRPARTRARSCGSRCGRRCGLRPPVRESASLRRGRRRAHAAGRARDRRLVRGPGHLEHPAADRRHRGRHRVRVRLPRVGRHRARHRDARRRAQPGLDDPRRRRGGRGGRRAGLRVQRGRARAPDAAAARAALRRGRHPAARGTPGPRCGRDRHLRAGAHREHPRGQRPALPR
ncbi:hypothetical protein BJF78_32225 [Pseudonocardia sp. CNS-139]|nr:hypothetical protein BJF78_32225 [Pseudonocardia sp. CNS-139]